MVKLLGILFAAILIAIPIMILDHIHGAGFLYKFFREQSLGIVATVLALNVATVTFLIGHLVNLETKAEEPIFKDTKKEVKDNVYFMFGMFLIIIFLVSSMNDKQVFKINSADYNPLIFFALVSFILIFVALFEIVQCIFSATQYIDIKTKKK